MPSAQSPSLHRASRVVALVLAAACGGEPSRTPDAMPWVKQRVALPTGITLAYVDIGEPTGDAVILLHGYTDTGRSFYPMMRHLHSLRPDLRLLAVDLRGHGASSMPAAEACRTAPEGCFHPTDFAADALAFMDHLGIGRADVVGHSFGSFVAQEIALTHPDRVRRLVLIGTFARGVEHPTWKELVRGARAWRDTLLQRGSVLPEDVHERTPLDVDSGMVTWMLANWVSEPLADTAFLATVAPETARIPLGTWLGVARAVLTVDHTERLKGLRVPTLVLWASQDAFFPESPDQQLVRALLDSAAARCGAGSVWKRYGRRPLPPSGLPDEEIAHNVQWAAPEGVAADLAAFLRDGGAPTPDLYYADPQNPRRVLTARGDATVIERLPRHCPAEASG